MLKRSALSEVKPASSVYTGIASELGRSHILKLDTWGIMAGPNNVDGRDSQPSEPSLPLPLPFDVVLRERPAEWLITDSQANRARKRRCLIKADDDLQAIEIWFAGYAATPNTIRAYKRDIARFYSWMVLLRQKALSSVTPEDLHQYESFLTNPPAEWCAPRYAHRTTGYWCPFEGPLRPESRRCTLAGVASCFGYLASVRYLIADPFQGWYPKRKKRSTENLLKKHLSLDDFAALIRALEAQSEAAAQKSRFQRQKAERELFVVSFLANTGLRRDELARARISDIRCPPNPSYPKKIQLLYVRRSENHVDEDTGEVLAGDRLVVLIGAARAAVERYRNVVMTNGFESDSDAHILQPIRKRKPPILPTDCFTGQTVYNIVCEALRSASAFYEKSDARLADLFREVSPQWMRYTFALVLRRLGAEPELIQVQLGCASVVNTLAAILDHRQLDLIQAISKLDR
jgi:integrase